MVSSWFICCNRRRRRRILRWFTVMDCQPLEGLSLGGRFFMFSSVLELMLHPIR
jgi:hypothetical protein